MRENVGGVNLIKIYCKHICRCHNVYSLYNYYKLIKSNNKKSSPKKTATTIKGSGTGGSGL
jgi:hypothetical protein